MGDAPELKYARRACPQCGARTSRQAETVCKATQGMDGDYHCAGNDAKEDAHGWLLFHTEASLNALDAWYQQQGLMDDAAAQRDMAEGGR